MKLTMFRYAICAALAATVAACGGGGGSDLSSMSSSGATTQSASMPLVVSDASSDDWALVGVRIMSIALVPQGGGDNVTVFTAASSAPYLNLDGDTYLFSPIRSEKERNEERRKQRKKPAFGRF